MRPEEIGPESSWLNQQDSNVERLKLDGEGFRKGCIRRCQSTRNTIEMRVFLYVPSMANFDIE